MLGVVTLGSGSQQNIGFALPVEYVRNFIQNHEAFAVSDSNPNQAYRYPDAPARKKPTENKPASRKEAK